MTTCTGTGQYVHSHRLCIAASDYNKDGQGGKWGLQDLKVYLTAKHGQERTDEAFARIQLLIIRTLESVQAVMMNDRQMDVAARRAPR